MDLPNTLDEQWVSKQVEELIKGPQHTIMQTNKENQLLPLLKALGYYMSNACKEYGLFLKRFNSLPESWQTIADIPPLPVSVFKRFELRSVPIENIIRELHSSSTTGQSPSRIIIDKTTAFRQSRALASLLKEYIGGYRRPFLVIDAKESVGHGDQISARGAAIRGISNFANQTQYAFDMQLDGQLCPNFGRVSDFLLKYSDEPILLFGFTFIIWTQFILHAEQRGLKFKAPKAIILHSGGWKKLTAQAVSKEIFNARTAQLLGCPKDNILDFYGMVEQVGTIFLDCEAMNKHAPAFADVIIRAPGTFIPVKPGEEGIIEVISVLPTSYPGHVLLTEDKGRLLGVDDCPCGRKGKYFRFTSRVEQTEVRGCGDTFAQVREIQ